MPLLTECFTVTDPRYVNNPELSDIQFMIEGHIFYAHKIILVNASNRFRAMLSNKFAESSQPVIEINDVRYQIFQVNTHRLISWFDIVNIMYITV